MLRELLAADIFRLLLVFARLGAAMMLFPAIGGVVVSPRARLVLALLVSLLLLPVLTPHLPAQPKEPGVLAVLLVGEITVGLFFGAITQLLMTALDLAGNFIGYAAGLTNALISDPVTEQQSQLISGVLNLAAATLLLMVNAHHLMLRALVDSYNLIPVGRPLPVGDFAHEMVRVMASSFRLGTELAAPFLVFSLAFNAGLGLLNRLVPQMQVFFVGMPIQILAGLAILMMTIPAIMLWFVRHFAAGIDSFLGAG